MGITSWTRMVASLAAAAIWGQGLVSPEKANFQPAALSRTMPYALRQCTTGTLSSRVSPKADFTADMLSATACSLLASCNRVQSQFLKVVWTSI